MLPHSAVGGRSPMPTKLSVEIATTLAASPNAISVARTGESSGRIWRRTIWTRRSQVASQPRRQEIQSRTGDGAHDPEILNPQYERDAKVERGEPSGCEGCHDQNEQKARQSHGAVAECGEEPVDYPSQPRREEPEHDARDGGGHNRQQPEPEREAGGMSKPCQHRPTEVVGAEPMLAAGRQQHGAQVLPQWIGFDQDRAQNGESAYGGEQRQSDGATRGEAQGRPRR